MKITTIAPFLDYYEKLRGRTLNVIKEIAHEHIRATRIIIIPSKNPEGIEYE